MTVGRNGFDHGRRRASAERARGVRLLLAAVLAGCHRPATEIVAVVSTDAAVTTFDFDVERDGHNRFHGTYDATVSNPAAGPGNRGMAQRASQTCGLGRDDSASIHSPSSSGPRWAMVSVIRRSSSGATPSLLSRPAIPHIF